MSDLLYNYNGKRGSLILTFEIFPFDFHCIATRFLFQILVGEIKWIKGILRDELVEVLVPSVRILIVEILAHCQNNVVGREVLRLFQNVRHQLL